MIALRSIPITTTVLFFSHYHFLSNTIRHIRPVSSFSFQRISHKAKVLISKQTPSTTNRFLHVGATSTTLPNTALNRFSPTTTKMSASVSPNISISDAFDGGNGELLETKVDKDGKITVLVKIRQDPYTELEKTNHFQYYSFRSAVRSINNEPMTVKYVLANAGEASYAVAWKDYTTFVSTTPSDPLSWTRKLDTTYDSTTGQLSWTHTHDRNEVSVYFAYFPPYSYERHLNLIAKVSEATTKVPFPLSVKSIGQTLDGREMECIKIGSGKSVCWIIHRQHPGETMASYYAEGLLDRLLGLSTNGSVDGLVRDLVDEKYTFYIIPCMCLDGAVRGHLRTNANGHNLNREWAPTGSSSSSTDDFYDAPTLERSPEVYYTLKEMDETGCDVFLDIHGDEELPFNFLAGSEGCPNWSERLLRLHGAFLACYARDNSDMQVPVSYEPEAVGEGRMNVCSNQIAVRYNCLAATLEMPFKDCLSNTDPVRGWNPARSMQLGASVLGSLAYVHPYLRANGEFWNNFKEEDAYVRPSENYKL